MSGHHHHAGAGWLPLLVLAGLAVAYLWLAAGRPRWSSWRTVSFVGGLGLVAAALAGPVAELAETDFRGHMLQHLLIGMLAPLALVLGAPVTLLLRALPARRARQVTRVLRSGWCHALANPWVALVLSVGGMVVLYCTPLYRVASHNQVVHELVHVHFLLAGYLFAWVIAGPDPGPRRPPVPVRLVVMGVAVAVHASFSQLMYAGLLVDLPVPAEQLRGAAELMYYGGDIAEMLLVLALLTAWRPSGRRGFPRARQAQPISSP